jgi:hypothetical protein
MFSRLAIRAPGRSNDAEFYDDGKRRAWLTRVFAPVPAEQLLIIGLNPSTAGASENDATINVEIGFATRWGFGWFVKVNLFDWIDTHPRGLLAAPTPAGDPQNIELIAAVADTAPAIWCCWGDGGALDGRASFLFGSLWQHRRKMFCLGKTRAGYPRHPLRQGYDTERVPMFREERAA